MKNYPDEIGQYWDQTFAGRQRLPEDIDSVTWNKISEKYPTIAKGLTSRDLEATFDKRAKQWKSAQEIYQDYSVKRARLARARAKLISKRKFNAMTDKQWRQLLSEDYGNVPPQFFDQIISNIPNTYRNGISLVNNRLVSNVMDEASGKFIPLRKLVRQDEMTPLQKRVAQYIKARAKLQNSKMLIDKFITTEQGDDISRAAYLANIATQQYDSYKQGQKRVPYIYRADKNLKDNIQELTQKFVSGLDAKRPVSIRSNYKNADYDFLAPKAVRQAQSRQQIRANILDVANKFFVWAKDNNIPATLAGLANYVVQNKIGSMDDLRSIWPSAMGDITRLNTVLTEENYQNILQ